MQHATKRANILYQKINYSKDDEFYFIPLKIRDFSITFTHYINKSTLISQRRFLYNMHNNLFQNIYSYILGFLDSDNYNSAEIEPVIDMFCSYLEEDYINSKK